MHKTPSANLRAHPFARTCALVVLTSCSSWTPTKDAVLGDALPSRARAAISLGFISSADGILLSHFENLAKLVGGEPSFGGGITLGLGIDADHYAALRSVTQQPPYGAPGAPLLNLPVVDERRVTGRANSFSEIAHNDSLPPAVAFGLSNVTAEYDGPAGAGDYAVSWQAKLYCGPRGAPSLGYYVTVELDCGGTGYAAHLQVWDEPSRVRLTSSAAR